MFIILITFLKLEICSQNISCIILFLWYDFRTQPHCASLSVPHVASLDKDAITSAEELPQCQRMGIMAAFNCFEDFKTCFSALMERFSNHMEGIDTSSVCNVCWKIKFVFHI